jgi:hypothetical protein
MDEQWHVEVYRFGASDALSYDIFDEFEAALAHGRALKEASGAGYTVRFFGPSSANRAQRDALRAIGSYANWP